MVWSPTVMRMVVTVSGSSVVGWLVEGSPDAVGVAADGADDPAVPAAVGRVSGRRSGVGVDACGGENGWQDEEGEGESPATAVSVERIG